MSIIQELIRVEEDRTLSFGNYLLDEKKKVEDFEVEGDLYKVKTFYEITKLEKNGILVYESVPGTTVHGFKLSEAGVDFSVEGNKNSSITVELEPEQPYKIFIDDVQVDKVKSNLSGKVTFSVNESLSPKKIKIDRI
ncbi:endosialidase [Vallitalea okinawensis]|uniref:endosialidase n=1 Tax=Vallitalea okinawensis TaxID=2078660 RepID=UPI000CFC8B76|nr:endosialidase [Vallitalea okinawensis]